MEGKVDKVANENYAHVLERVAKTEQAITALEGDVKAVASTVNDIRSIILEHNKPEPPNVIGWIGVGFTVVSLIGILLFGMAEYVQMQIDPIRDTMAARQKPLDEFWMFKNEMHYEMGKIHEREEWVSEALDELDERVDEAEDMFNESRVVSSGARRRLEAMEKELDKIDVYGSRRWGAKPAD